MNARGQVVGDNPAYLWKNGVTTMLPGFPGAANGWGPQAFAINARGTVAGTDALNADSH